MSPSPTISELKEMTPGEQSVHFITVMDNMCDAVKELTERNSKEHEEIKDSMSTTDNIIFEDIKALEKGKISFKLFIPTITLIAIVLSAFAGTIFLSSKDITNNTACIKSLERAIYPVTKKIEAEADTYEMNERLLKIKKY